ncbi:nucleoside hydrolase [Steroidobacter sp. S1-65]|uniref:Nucleoside hydrolase n=1 Tax=Steroidobacter gossypii TaxID=2805490 RepID=A0ABS1WVL0_9GAMM|nr:nucleoside hydrolase [Steroidobacter gossypii]MBM0105012.1 nucleoside hydrolase [Steroidobacter gossypii]
MDKHQILIDTDPGVDDAMALLFLRALPTVRIAAITTVFGNADIGTTTHNACYLAERFAIEAPVIAGAAQPLYVDRSAAPVHVHGRNGLGDADLRLEGRRAIDPGPAHERIVELIRARPHELTILAIGPLTNLALALRLDPGIASLVSQVVVMGGAFGWNGRRGNVSPVAEANMRHDPHAADEVLAASWPVTMVGLDVTSRCVFTTEEACRLAAQGGEAGQFLWDISRGYEAMYRTHDGVEGFCLHDVAAAAYVIAPEIFATSRGPIRVVTEGIAIGQTIQPAPGHSFPAGAWDHVPAQRACKDVDAPRLLGLYADTLISHAHSASLDRRPSPASQSGALP